MTETSKDLTIKEAADVLRLNSDLLRSICAEGLMPGAYRTRGDRGHWRIPAAGIDEYRRNAAARARSVRAG